MTEFRSLCPATPLDIALMPLIRTWPWIGKRCLKIRASLRNRSRCSKAKNIPIHSWQENLCVGTAGAFAWQREGGESHASCTSCQLLVATPGTRLYAFLHAKLFERSQPCCATIILSSSSMDPASPFASHLNEATPLVEPNLTNN